MSLISIKNSRVSIGKASSFKSVVPKIIEEPDYFWTNLQSEPNYTDTPDGVITYDGATSSLLISDRAALTDYQDTSISMCYGNLNASNCTSLNTVSLGITYVEYANLEGCGSLNSLNLNFEPNLKFLNTNNCTSLTTVNAFYVGKYNPPELMPVFDFSTSPLISSLTIQDCILLGLNLSGNTQLTNLEFGLGSSNASYMSFGLGGILDISNSNIQTCNASYCYCREFSANNCTSLWSLNLAYASVTDLSLINLPSLTFLNIPNTLNVETINLNNVNISTFESNSHPLLTSINIVDCSSLSYLYVTNCNSEFTGDLTLSGSMSLTYIGMSGNSWSASAVDNVLLAIETWVTSQNATGGTINLLGNSAPTTAGESAKTNLEDNYSWTVNVVAGSPGGIVTPTLTIWSGLNYEPSGFTLINGANTYWDPGTGTGDGTITIQNGQKTDLTSLNSAYTYGLGGVVDVSGCTNLTYLSLGFCDAIGLNITDCTSLTYLEIWGTNFISDAEVSLAIRQLDYYGNTNGNLSFNNSTVLTPEAELAKTSLQGKGWLITTFN